jgi:Flp pilus assembly pilin Flp
VFDNQGETTVMKKKPSKHSRKSLMKSTLGASFTEYILMVGLIVVAGIAAWTAFGTDIDTAIQAQGDAVGAEAVRRR